MENTTFDWEDAWGELWLRREKRLYEEDLFNLINLINLNL